MGLDKLFFGLTTDDSMDGGGRTRQEAKAEHIEDTEDKKSMIYPL